MPLQIGFGAYEHFDGLMSDVRLYNRALNAGEVAVLAPRLLSPTPTSRRGRGLPRNRWGRPAGQRLPGVRAEVRTASPPRDRRASHRGQGPAHAVLPTVKIRRSFPVEILAGSGNSVDQQCFLRARQLDLFVQMRQVIFAQNVLSDRLRRPTSLRSPAAGCSNSWPRNPPLTKEEFGAGLVFRTHGRPSSLFGKDVIPGLGREQVPQPDSTRSAKVHPDVTFPGWHCQGVQNGKSDSVCRCRSASWLWRSAAFGVRGGWAAAICSRTSASCTVAAAESVRSSSAAR